MELYRNLLIILLGYYAYNFIMQYANWQQCTHISNYVILTQIFFRYTAFLLTKFYTTGKISHIFFLIFYVGNFVYIFYFSSWYFSLHMYKSLTVLIYIFYFFLENCVSLFMNKSFFVVPWYRLGLDTSVFQFYYRFGICLVSSSGGISFYLKFQI